MKFIRSENDENFTVLKLVSEGGQWELGCCRVLFGVRIKLGRAGSGFCALDYCAGDNPLFQLELLNAVRIILLKVPEDADYPTVEMMFPGFSIKPIDLDPTCWKELQKLRDKIKAEFNIQEEILPIV